MNQTLLLKVDGLRCYRGPVEALRGISFDVKSAEVTCLVGPNGAGKTSTLLCIMGLVKAHEGSIMFEGQEIKGLLPNKVFNTGIAFVPEDRRVFPDLTVKENLELGQSRERSENCRIGFDEIIDIFPPLGKLMKRKGVFLSGGEQKMVSIARSMMSSPKLILLDEPLEGLAPSVVGRFTDALQRIKEMGITVVQVESNLRLAERVADYYYALERGEVFFKGTPEELDKDKQAMDKLVKIH